MSVRVWEKCRLDPKNSFRFASRHRNIYILDPFSQYSIEKRRVSGAEPGRPFASETENPSATPDASTTANTSFFSVRTPIISRKFYQFRLSNICSKTGH